MFTDPLAASTVPTRDRDARPALAARIGGWIVFATLLLVVWMDQSVFPIGIAVQGPDGSFQTAFEHFFEHGYRAGVDWVYTYGPLGFIENLTYAPNLFFGRLIFADVLWRLVCAALVTHAFLRNHTGFERATAFVVLVATPLKPDAFVFLFILAVVEVCMADPRNSLLVLAAIALVPASLAKFTWFVLWIPCTIAIGSVVWRARSRRAALWYAGGSVAIWIVLWCVVCRQSLLDVPVFLARSFEMASAYSAAMASECPAAIQERGFWVLGLTAACCALPLFDRARTRGRLAPALIRAFILVGAFKAGFVRGADHSVTFFVFAGLAPFVIVDELPAGSWWRVAQVCLRYANLMIACFGVLVGYGYVGPVATTFAARAGERIDWTERLLFEMKPTRAELDRQLALARAERALPRTRQLVGTETIDIHPPFQDTILFNDLHWRPRPVFQSYATLSEGLQRLNARFFESDRAPQWFLLQPRAIDGRLETMEDAPALLVIARDYRPVLLEQDMLLLRRDPQPVEPPADEVVIDRELAFGEALDLSSLGDDVHLLQLDASPTWLGRLRALVLRPAPIHAVLATEDGRQVRVQLIPNMLRTGAIIDPLLVDVRDWVRFYAGRADRTRTLTLVPSDLAWAHASTLRVRILRSSMRPRRVDIDSEPLERYAMFETMPSAFFGVDGGRVANEAGHSVFAAGAPSVLKFNVAPGQRSVRGSFGLLAEAYEKGASDGVTFQAHYLRGHEQFRKVFERTIDPRANPAERGVLPFEFAFEAEIGGEIALSVRPGPNQDATDDSAFWTDLSVK